MNGYVCVCLIPGILLLGRGQDDIAESRALSHENDIIDIYSNSWGPFDDGFRVEGPLALAKRTFKEGTQKVIRAESPSFPITLSLISLFFCANCHLACSSSRDEMEKAPYMCGLLAMEAISMTRVLQMVM